MSKTIEDFKARERARRLRSCRHQRATGLHADCKAGVNYYELSLKHTPYYDPDDPTAGWLRRLPCTPGRDDEPEIDTCPLRDFWTEAEVDAQQRERDRRIAQTMTARRAIVEAIGPYVEGESGTEMGVVDCPICENKESLQYRRAGCNGHIHALCKTVGCVAWME